MPAAELGVSFHDLNVYSPYSGAIAPASLQLACAPRHDQLIAHFHAHRLPYEPQVLRRIESLYCHITYEPTTYGFKAHTESEPVQGVYVDVPHLRLLSQTPVVLGDSLDIVKAVLARAQEPLDVSLGVAMTVPQSFLERAVAAHFRGTKHRVRLRVNPETSVNSWSQDFIKSGETRKGRRLLVPRRIFEGDRDNGAQYKSLLDSLSSQATSRSRLSWEGGDLMLVRDPDERERLVLLYGDAARPYWAQNLSEEEYAYVLRVEFGADEALYFGGIAPHVDYVVSFLPEDRVALLAKPVTGNLEMARAAARHLRLSYAAESAPALKLLEEALADPLALEAAGATRVRAVIAHARKEAGRWAVPVNTAAYEQIQSHIAAHCPNDAVACVGPKLLPSLMNSDPDLLSDWVRMAAVMRAAENLPTAMLSVIEDQLPGATAQKESRLAEAAEQLERLGFRVVRIPWIGGEMTGKHPWAGISYANLVLLERDLFVPAYGLGAPEQQLLDSIEPSLPAGYRVKPIHARSALLMNGGVHCVVGLVRGSGTFLLSRRHLNDHAAVGGQRGVPESVTSRMTWSVPPRCDRAGSWRRDSGVGILQARRRRFAQRCRPPGR
jgi:hypothetical protein